MAEIVMPRLSDSMEEGTILTWLKQVGDEVAVGDELVEIETDKANMAYESDVAGTLTEILAAGGRHAGDRDADRGGRRPATAPPRPAEPAAGPKTSPTDTPADASSAGGPQAPCTPGADLSSSGTIRAAYRWVNASRRRRWRNGWRRRTGWISRR